MYINNIILSNFRNYDKLQLEEKVDKLEYIGA